MRLWLLSIAGSLLVAGAVEKGAAARPAEGAAAALTGPRFVGVEGVAGLQQAGAVVLDARSSGFLWAHIPSAQAVDWLDFRDGWGRVGRLHPDPQAMASKLSALGVDAARPVLVYGAAAARFGEEGRIAWLLLYLGHPQVYILDGGFAAWQGAGKSVARGPVRRPAQPGGFAAQPQPGLRADKAQVQRALSAATEERPVLVDARSEAEWAGATPYLEARGGHIPGARSLPWGRLLDARGQLKPAAELRRELAARGLGELSPDREIIVYCTGGVRSAFVVVVLAQLGYRRVKNYDGSFWEWAADNSLPVEGDKKRN